MIPILNYFIFFTLVLPFSIMTMNHSFRIVRSLSRLFLISSIFFVVIALPFHVLYTFGYYVVIPLVMPLMFRCIGFILDKLRELGWAEGIYVTRFVPASVCSITLIVVTSLLGELDKYSLMILIVFLLIFSGFSVVQNFQKVSGGIFGPIIAVFPVYIIKPEINSIVVLIFVWLLISMLMTVFLKITKKTITEKVEPYKLTLILLVTVLINHFELVSHLWLDISLQIITFASIHCIFYLMLKFINKLHTNRAVHHFTPIWLAILCVYGFHLLLQTFPDVNQFDGLEMLLILECFFITVGRLTTSMSLVVNSSYFLHIENILDITKSILGERLGIPVNRILFGKKWRELPKKYCVMYSGITIILLTLSFMFIQEMNLNALFFQKPYVLMILTTNAVISALTFLNMCIKLSNQQNYMNGLEQNEAISSVSMLTIEYVAILAPIAYLKWDYFTGLQLYIQIFVCIYLVMIFININTMLFVDLQKKNYDNLYGIRLLLSQFLQATPFLTLIIIYISFPDISPNHHEQVVVVGSKLFFLSVVCNLVAKLIGYDTEIASKKHYFFTIFSAIFMIISTKIFLAFTYSIMFVITQNGILCYKVYAFLALSIVCGIARAVPIVLIPYSHKSNNSIFDDWSRLRPKNHKS